MDKEEKMRRNKNAVYNRKNTQSIFLKLFVQCFPNYGTSKNRGVVA